MAYYKVAGKVRHLISGGNSPINLKQVMTKKPSADNAVVQIFSKDVLMNGQPTNVDCIELGGQTYTVSKGPLRVVRLEDEWFEDVFQPEAVIETLKRQVGFRPDLITFRQHLPDTQPKFSFYTEWESFGALPIQSYDYWWHQQIKGTTRNMIRKSQKAGVEVRASVFDDAFVRGMTEIFNETPMRQGRRFWHYGKDFETVKRQFSRFLFREELIGAYYQDELVGFAMLGCCEKFADLGQIIAKIQHRDKAITNALVAKAVQVCESKGIPYLGYGYWSEDSLSDFKRHCGFTEQRLPRFFVPLSTRGKVSLKLGLHKSWRDALPRQIKDPLKKLRALWQSRQPSTSKAPHVAT